MRRYSCVFLAVIAAGCSTTTTAPKTGSLTVTVTASASVNPRVTVTGSNGFKKTVTSTTTLRALATGSYAITAPDVTTADSIVGSVYHPTVTGTPATVSVGGDAAATVTYAARSGSGALWVVGGINVGPNTISTAIAYTASQLHASSSAPPSIALNFPVTPGGNVNANAVAFDAHGNLWLVNDNTNTVVEYASGQLGASGSPTPAVTIQLANASYWLALAFDAKGDLWVVDEDSAAIVEFTPDQLTASGSTAPAITLRMGMIIGQRANPLAIAFDGQGNLWVVDGSWRVLQYTASQLDSSGTLAAPAVEISSSVPYPYNLAFDKFGNLWVATETYFNITNGTDTTLVPGPIIEFAASSLTPSGSPAPTRTINLPTGAKYGTFAAAIAFDDSGDLWYSDFNHATIGEYTLAQLGAGGNPSPAVTIVNTTPVFGTSLAFNPHTTSLPLH